MGSLSQDIEQYLKSMLDQTDGGVLIVQRSMLSEKFCCVPSQINYVLQTRFTPAKGYVVETRRGGGGYVRIQSIPLGGAHDFRPLLEQTAQSLTERDEESIIGYLVEEEIIPPDVGTMLKSILKDRMLQSLRTLSTDEIRARMMSHLLAHMSISAKTQQNDRKTTAVSDEKDADKDTKTGNGKES